MIVSTCKRSAGLARGAILTVLTLLPSIMLLSHLQADEKQSRGYGIVTAVSDGNHGQEIQVSMSPGVDVLPGAVLALYGPGAVQRHPLTDEVIIEDRVLVAKAVVNAIEAGSLRARVVWQAGDDSDGSLAEGFDAVLMPGPRPNAAPVLQTDALRCFRLDPAGERHAVDTRALPAQASIVIETAISDPDADPLFYRWHISGAHPGALQDSITTVPRVVYNTPMLPGSEVTIHVTAHDPWGEQVRMQGSLKVGDTISAWNRRQTMLGASIHSRLPAWVDRALTSNGQHLFVGNDGNLYRRRSYARFTPFPFPSGAQPRQVSRIHPRSNGGFVILDRSQDQAIAFDHRGNVTAMYEGMDDTTDMVVLADGRVAVSDPRAGGIHIFAEDGSYRARLGRNTNVTRLEVHPDGRFIALDGGTHLREFSPWLEPVQSWSIAIEDGERVIDIAYHSNDAARDGRLVLLSSGSIRQYDAEGLLLETWQAVAQHPLLSRAGEPSGMSIDGDGHIRLWYPSSQAVVHLDHNGSLLGLQMPIPRDAQWVSSNGSLWLADVRGGALYRLNRQGWIVNVRALPQDIRDLTAVHVSPDGRILVLLDGRESQVHVYDGSDVRVAPIVFGQSGNQRGQFRRPIAIATDQEHRIYVLDDRNDKVSVFANDGRLLFEFGEGGRDAHQWRSPQALAVSPDGSQVVVFDNSGNLLKRHRLNHEQGTTEHVGNLGGSGSGPGQIRRLAGIGFDRLGLLYVADDRRNDVQIWDIRGGNAVTVHAIEGDALGVNRLEKMSLDADGTIVLYGREEMALHHW